MTRSRPLDDAQLDRVLGFDRPPPMPEGLADRIAAEAVRTDRILAMSPAPSRRERRRPWRRPRFIAGFVAFNLIAVSAIAAALGSHVIDVPKLAELSTQIFHQRQKAVPAARHVPKAKVARQARAPVLDPVAAPSQDVDWGPPPPRDIRPRWAMRPNAAARFERVRERRRERALGIAGMRPADRLHAIERDLSPGARQPRAWGPARPFALRRDRVGPGDRDIWAMPRAEGPRRAQWAQRRAERRLDRQRRFPGWRSHFDRRRRRL